MKKGILVILAVLLVVVHVFAQTEADFEYGKESDGGIYIKEYKGSTTEVIIPEDIDGGKVTSISTGVFWNKSLTKVTLPNSIRSIGDSSFRNNQLTSIIIPDGVTTIRSYAFRKNQLTSVTLPDSVKTIGEFAFADNPLTSIIIPDNVASFNVNIVEGARNLTKITIGANVDIKGTALMAYNFAGFYIVNGRRAGTYTYSNGNWSAKYR